MEDNGSRTGFDAGCASSDAASEDVSAIKVPDSDREFSRCPLFVDMTGKLVVIVGGGQIATHKAEALLAYGANIRMVSRTIRAGARALADLDGVTVTWEDRSPYPDDATRMVVFAEHAYRASDLDGAFMVIAATSDREVNAQVAQDARERGILANITDDLEACSVVLPSSLQRGRLQIAVSTGGASPIVARSIRRELEGIYDESWSEYLDLMAQTRVLIQDRVPGGTDIRKPLYRTLTTGELLDWVREGGHPSAEEAYERFVAPLLHAAESDGGDTTR